MPNWKFERKIYLALTVAICAFLPLVCVSLFAIHQLITDENKIIDTNAKQTLLIERLQFFNAARSRQFLLYVLTKDKKQRDSFYEFHGLFNSVLAEIVNLEMDPPDRVLLAKIKSKSDGTLPYRENAFKMVEDGQSSVKATEYFEHTSAKASREISSLARELAISSAESEFMARKRVQRNVRNLEFEILILTLLATVLLIWATTLIVKVSKQKREADEHVFRISEARKEIVEIVAHDVKSPVATIQMTVELMKDELLGEINPAALKKKVDMIDRSAKAIHSLITDLLNHTKIEAGNMVIEAKPCDIPRLVENVATRFKPLASARKLQFDISVPPNEIVALCDPIRMDQVLSNLLGNALKFTPDNGRILVTCRKADNDVEFSVEDSGAGIEQDQLPHIFDRYWQVRKNAQQGTGLGLAIVKSIVEAHHGRIWVNSVLGKGTTFFVSLPQQ